MKNLTNPGKDPVEGDFVEQDIVCLLYTSDAADE